MINDLKELEKFLKIIRRQGVTKATFGSLTVELGDLPQEQLNLGSQPEVTDQLAGFPQGELTPEQLIFYSSGGLPENDPYRKGEAN